ncbi:MAG: hypothetical protein O3A88_03295 [Proteobacteria bacterium]|nr:hypothetical protein [Pseudomonadota bacterium]
MLPIRAKPANGWNSRSRARGLRPGPSSATSITNLAPLTSAEILMRCAPALKALRTRLLNAR